MSNRIYYLDTMRGVLMILILVLHSAYVFDPEQIWGIYSEKSTFFATILIETIRISALPAFFIVSGYFAIASLRKDSAIDFLKKRIVMRLFIPTVVTAITLNTLQTYLLVDFGWKEFNSLQEYILNGEWKSHLWFLINLIIYFLTILVLSVIFKSKLYSTLNLISKTISKIPFFILLPLLPFAPIFFLAIGKIHPIKGIIDSSALLVYLAFFIFGLLLNSSKTLIKKFTELSVIYNLLSIAISLILTNQLENSSGFVWFIIKFYFLALAMWSSSSLCFYIFKNFTNYYSRVFEFLSNASYTVYLFHHHMVIALGLLFIHYGIGGLGGMLLLIILVSVLSISVHHFIISKVDILSFLFNGKSLK